jgi:type III restriction enzyme
MTTVSVTHGFLGLAPVLERLAKNKEMLFTSELTDEQRLNEVVGEIVAEETAKQAAIAEYGIDSEQAKKIIQEEPLLFPVSVAGTEVKKFDPAILEKELKEKLRKYAKASIDVPDIGTETSTVSKLELFEIKVTTGPFELVDQRVLTQDLATGEEKEREKLEVLEIDNPTGFLAARVIEAVEELDVANDKEAVMSLVEKYLELMRTPKDEIGKIAHLYRDVIVKDIKNQIEQHIHDESKVTVYARSGFVQFKPYSKTVLAKDGIVKYTQEVAKGDIKRYLFDGFNKSLYLQVPFDSTPEKYFAGILERDSDVVKWIRPPDGNVPIMYKGHWYNPDFIVQTEKAKYLIEVKARSELEPTLDQEVKEKAMSAIRWCKTASEIDKGFKWEYKLIPDDVITSTNTFKFVVSQAVNVG